MKHVQNKKEKKVKRLIQSKKQLTQIGYESLVNFLYFSRKVNENDVVDQNMRSREMSTNVSNNAHPF